MIAVEHARRCRHRRRRRRRRRCRCSRRRRLRVTKLESVERQLQSLTLRGLVDSTDKS